MKYTAHLLKWLRLKRPQNLCGRLHGREVCREWIHVYVCALICMCTYVAAWMGRRFAENEYMCMYGWVPLFPFVHLKLSQDSTRIISYIPIQSKKFKRKKTNKKTKELTIPSVGKDGEEPELSYSTGGNVCYNRFGKQSNSFLNAQHTQATIWSRHSFPKCFKKNGSSCPYKDLCIDVHSHFTLNIPKLEITKVYQ